MIPEQERYKVELEFCVVPERKEGIEEYLDMAKEQRNHLKRALTLQIWDNYSSKINNDNN